MNAVVSFVNPAPDPPPTHTLPPALRLTRSLASAKQPFPQSSRGREEGLENTLKSDLKLELMTHHTLARGAKGRPAPSIEVVTFAQNTQQLRGLTQEW